MTTESTSRAAERLVTNDLIQVVNTSVAHSIMGRDIAEDVIEYLLAQGWTPPDGHGDFTRRVLALFAGDIAESLTWTGDGITQPLQFVAWVNDVFLWGADDHEPITPETLPDLEKAFAEVRAIEKDDDYQAVVLWCARKRGIRPQGAHYQHLRPSLTSLLDACGPLREVGLGNPHCHPSQKGPRHG
jgi:hypothetical protein